MDKDYGYEYYSSSSISSAEWLANCGKSNESCKNFNGNKIVDQAQQIIRNLYSYFVDEKEFGKPIANVHHILKRLVNATGVSESVIRKIC